MRKTIKVVAAIIENDNQEILCALRSPSMSLPNMWEFPGGKVEKDEDLHAALEREIAEEFSCKIKALDMFNENLHDYDTFTVNLITLKAKLVEEDLILTEHSKIVWLKRGNLKSLVWAPADIPAVEELINEKV